MKIDGNQIKVGNILQINSKLWRVIKTQHTQPGKGGAYLQVEMKEIREGTKMNERFRSSLGHSFSRNGKPYNKPPRGSGFAI